MSKYYKLDNLTVGHCIFNPRLTQNINTQLNVAEVSGNAVAAEILLANNESKSICPDTLLVMPCMIKNIV